MRYLKVLLAYSESMVHGALFAPWELPILEAVHGSEKVQVVGEEIKPTKPYPDAREEYDRLALRYKEDPSGRPHVDLIYGHGGHKLADAIEEAALAEADPSSAEEPAPQPKPAPKKTAAKKAASKPVAVEPEPIGDDE